jgi:serine/threonine-protein kinase
LDPGERVEPAAPIAVGRYLLHQQIARGGMATIHIARAVGDIGFSRIVAAKRLRPELARDREFVTMFLDEARIASKVHHRNVVPVLDVVATGEVVLVQEMVRGAPLSLLLRAAHGAGSPVPLPVAMSIATQVLGGLHAAHETCDELGAPLHIIHRDVSPQNIMIATDGTARLLDFGVAKAAASAHVTKKGTFKGKLAYAAPEQIRGHATKQTDVYALAVVLWELVVGDRLFRDAKTEDEIIEAVLKGTPPTITEALEHERAGTSGYRWNQLETIAPIIQKGLASDPRRRWQTAAEMEEALTAALPMASGSDVADWLQALAGDFLDARDRMIADVEAQWRAGAVPIALPPPGGTGAHDSISNAVEPPRPAWSTKQRVAVGLSVCTAIAMVIAVIVHGLTMAEPEAAPPAPAIAPARIEPPPPPPPNKTVAPEPAAVPTPEPATIPEPAQTSTPEPPTPEVPARRPAPKPIMRPVPHPVAHVAKPAPKAAPPPPPPPPPPAPPAVAKPDCNPPYYYEGAKKVFKPACI